MFEGFESKKKKGFTRRRENNIILLVVASTSSTATSSSSSSSRSSFSPQILRSCWFILLSPMWIQLIFGIVFLFDNFSY